MICKAAPTDSLLTQFFLCLCDYASVKGKKTNKHELETNRHECQIKQT